MSLSPRVSRLVKVLLAAILAINIVGFVALRVMFPWMFWSPDTGSASPDSTPGAKSDLISVASVSPAQRAVDNVMAFRSRGFGPPWRPTDRSAGVPALPAALDCAQDPALAPVYADSRGWVQASGPLPQNITSSVQISVRAYSAGAGGLALEQLVTGAEECSGTVTSQGPPLGVESELITAGRSSALIWRRGDVLVVVTTRSVLPLDLLGVWQKYDTALDVTLEGLCADQQSSAEDASRSPYADRKQFVGLTKDTVVQAPTTARVPLPAPSPGAATPSEVPIPAPELSAPEPTFVATPSPPVTPQALPSPVDSPSSPDAPSRPPQQKSVGMRIPDPIGPGCGWSFTGQAQPAYDAAAARAGFRTDLRTTRTSLQRAWGLWQRERVSYFVAYADYARAMQRYSDYATQVNQVTAAWTQVLTLRYAYADALRAWRSANDRYNSFILRQQQAQVQYDNAVATCNSTPPPVSVDPTLPPPPVPGCPPVPRPILSKQPPRVPPKPAAPDASFPEYRNPGHQVAQ